MNIPINNGGPAFPQTYESWRGADAVPDGMSVRTWLTGKALQGMLAAESENYGNLHAVRTDPNTGLTTYREVVYPLNPETKQEDYTKPPIPTIIVMTSEQHLVHRCIQIADEAILQLSKPQTTTPKT